MYQIALSKARVSLYSGKSFSLQNMVSVYAMHSYNCILCNAVPQRVSV